MALYLSTDHPVTTRVSRRAPALPIVGMFVMVLGVISMHVRAQDTVAMGANLAQRVYERPDGEDSVSRGKMVLTEHGGKPRIRDIFSFRREPSPGNLSTLIRFDSPPDIRGVGMLTLDAPGEESRQWLYLPELGRVRRISSARKGGRFVDSDFFYEDLRDREPGEDRHRLTGREEQGGVVCDVLESVPLDSASSVYERRVSWIDPQSLLALRVDYFKRGRAEPIKRYIVVDKAVIDGFWTVTDGKMIDLVGAHETRLTVDRIVYDQGLSADLFRRTTLEDPVRDMPYRP